jgi:RNA polymerase sigma factor (TIGR02999 family)
VKEPQAITGLLAEWHGGDEDAFRELLPIVFHELRKLARHHLARESPGHTLQPTALVNEVYLKMVGSRAGLLENRTHFFAFAAQLMREILVDHARARMTAKRGGKVPRVGLDEAFGVSAEGVDLTTVLVVDAALKRLEALDERQARVVTLRYFSGLTLKEIADVLGISLATVERQWSVARRFLAREIGGERSSR